MQWISARHIFALSLCLACVSTPVFAVYGTTEGKEQFEAKALVSATNGILTVQIENSNASDLGEFTVITGTGHPNPGQPVLFPVGTSYITLRDVTSQEVWADSSSGASNLERRCKGGRWRSWLIQKAAQGQPTRSRSKFHFGRSFSRSL